MAALRRGKKEDAVGQKRELDTRPRKSPRRQKKVNRPKRNVCIIRFPKSSYLTTCPLVSWYFNRRMRDDSLALQKDNPDLIRCLGEAHRMMPLRLGKQRRQHPTFTCSAFLRRTLKEIAEKKRAKWVVTASKKRRRFSDEEIFYRLAKPSDVGSRTEEGRAGAGGGAEEETPRTSGVSQPMASRVQEALS